MRHCGDGGMFCSCEGEVPRSSCRSQARPWLRDAQHLYHGASKDPLVRRAAPGHSLLQKEEALKGRIGRVTAARTRGRSGTSMHSTQPLYKVYTCTVQSSLACRTFVSADEALEVLRASEHLTHCRSPPHMPNADMAEGGATICYTRAGPPRATPQRRTHCRLVRPTGRRPTGPSQVHVHPARRSTLV
jgi:hypothetical protein